MTTLTVGSGQQYSTIAAAVAASHDGDVIQVQAGTYTNDFAEIKTKITLQGVGGMVHMVATKPIPGDKGILVTDTDVTIDHFEFSGAAGASGNDAGIRYQGGNLVLTNDYFHDNQNGLLANPSANGTISISNSEFAHNGAGDGYTHNLYVGDIAKLAITNSYFHDAVLGHEIKSRAEVTEITNSRIFDNSATASYSIDVPNGGKTTITGNVIEQGAHSQNPNIIAYGEEGSLHAGSSLTVANNTVLNDLANGKFVWDASGTAATVDHNSVWGLSASQMAAGSGAKVTNTATLGAEPALDTSHPWSSGGSTTPPSDGGSTAPPSSGGGSTTPPAGGGGATTPPSDGGGSTTPPPSAGVTWIGGSASDHHSGGAGADSLSGQSGADWLSGLGGADTLAGGSGADTLIGGAGKDLLVGGGGDDVYKLESGGGSDTIQGFAAHSRWGREHDHIDTSALGVTKATFASAVHVSDTSAGALITVGDTQVTVLGMHASSFNASDFLLA
jgi:hypothetical protein